MAPGPDFAARARPRSWRLRLAPLLLGTLPLLLLVDFGAASLNLVLSARAFLIVTISLVAVAFAVSMPHGRRVAFAIAGTFLLASLLSDAFLLGTRKEFLRRAGRLAPGMGASEVAAAMDQAPDAEFWGGGDSFYFEGVLPGDSGGCDVQYDERGRVSRVSTHSDIPVLEPLMEARGQEGQAFVE